MRLGQPAKAGESIKPGAEAQALRYRLLRRLHRIRR
jgi:hypothetical protein